MSLHLLPLELLSKILRQLDTPRDLLSCIISSTPSRAIFNSSPALILSSVLHNAIKPEAVPHALAAFHLMAKQPSKPDDLDSFIDKYFGMCSFEFPPDLSGLTSFCHLYNRISFFIDDFSSRAMQALATSPSTAQTLPLSSAEVERFQRAFFRYEVYCSLYPPAIERQEPGPQSTAEAQFHRFLARLQIWEVEEMSCVHFYYITLMGGFMDQIEDQFVAAALIAASGVPEPKDEHDEMFTFDFLEYTILFLFAGETHDRANDIVSYFASFGAFPIFKLCVAVDEQWRRRMIHRSSHPVREFLPQAIEAAPTDGTAHDPFRTPARHMVSSDTSSCVNSGLDVFNCLKGYRYITFRLDSSHSFLRERAFLFWDAERILKSPETLLNLREPASLSDKAARRRFDRRSRKSVPERLKGVKITQAQLGELEKEFGPPDKHQRRKLQGIPWRELWTE